MLDPEGLLDRAPTAVRRGYGTLAVQTDTLTMGREGGAEENTNERGLVGVWHSWDATDGDSAAREHSRVASQQGGAEVATVRVSGVGG